MDENALSQVNTKDTKLRIAPIDPNPLAAFVLFVKRVLLPFLSWFVAGSASLDTN
jgi:hypothetical protein